MATAALHDGAKLDVTVLGDGPAVLLPVRTARYDAATAEMVRRWGGDPDLGPALLAGLAGAGFRVVAADYEGHLAEHPKPSTLTADAVAADLLAVADAAGADRFACYGYSWLALAGLQLALRTDRLTALAMGGYPPLGGPYEAMLTVTRAAHRMALEHEQAPPSVRAEPGDIEPGDIEPGDWDSVPVEQSPEQTQQYLTLYQSLRGFDERAALAGLTVPRLAFAGTEDDITYGPQWDGARVVIGSALRANREELVAQGWTVELVEGADHLQAMRAATVLPLLTAWLRANVR